MTKGDLMKKVFSEDELRNVDSAIPMESWNTVDNTFYWVMDYNNKGPFGKLTDMRELAKERNITLN